LYTSEASYTTFVVKRSHQKHILIECLHVGLHTCTYWTYWWI